MSSSKIISASAVWQPLRLRDTNNDYRNHDTEYRLNRDYTIQRGAAIILSGQTIGVGEAEGITKRFLNTVETVTVIMNNKSTVNSTSHRGQYAPAKFHRF